MNKLQKEAIQKIKAGRTNFYEFQEKVPTTAKFAYNTYIEGVELLVNLHRNPQMQQNENYNKLQKEKIDECMKKGKEMKTLLARCFYFEKK